MKRIFKYLSSLVLIASFSFIFSLKVDAISNLNGLSDLTIDPFGLFYDNINNTSRSIGYTMNLVGEGDLFYYIAYPTGSTTYTYNGRGGSIVQCDMSFVAGNYYSVSFYWLSDSMSYYYHPYYSTLSNKLAIGTGSSVSYPTFTYESISTDVQRKLVNGLGYLSSYTIIFKAPRDGTCLLSTFSSNPTGPSDGLGFVGYTYRSLGSSAPSSSDIALELKGQFESIENSLNSAIGSVIGSINSSNTQIGDKIDDVESSINNNINDLKEKQDEQNETSKGIWASLTDGIANIGKWFTDLTSSIGNFFSELGASISEGFSNVINDIKSIFIGEEVCEVSHINLIQYEGVKSDGDGWYSYSCTSSSCPQFTVSYIDTIKNATYYNSFFEIKDLVSTGNYRIQPFFSYSGQFGSSALAPFFVQDGNLSVEATDIIKKGNLFNHRTTYAYLNSSDYFTKFSVVRYIGSSISFKFRVLVTDDMSMTVDNYEYYDKKEECTSSGGLFGMINDFMNFVKEGFVNLLTGLIEGIKALFVPTDEQLYEIIDDSKELTENFGFVGQSVSFFITIFTSLLGLVNANGCLEFPEFSIGQTSLFDSHKFWDKQVVCLNDNTILSSNISTIRTITSIVLVCMFINFAASKFFTILSKNDYANDTSGIDYFSDDNGNAYITEYQRSGKYSFRKRSKL